MFYSWIPKTVPGLTKCFILEKPTFWSWWMNLPEINASRISLKMRQNYRTFCRTLLGHPGQFLTTTDQLSYYLIIRHLWLAVPNGPIRISIANELRLNDLFFGHTFFRHFSDYWWRHHFYDVFIILYLLFYIYLFILDKKRNKKWHNKKITENFLSLTRNGIKHR